MLHACAYKTNFIMKPKRFKPIPRQKSVPGYPKSTRTVKPLRFYVAGGPDVDGNAMKQDKRSMSDPDADSDVWMTLFGTDSEGQPAVFADPFCDPRHDVFSIAAMAGSPDYKAAVEKAIEQQQSGTAAVDSASAAAADSAAQTN